MTEQAQEKKKSVLKVLLDIQDILSATPKQCLHIYKIKNEKDYATSKMLIYRKCTLCGDESLT